MKNQPGAGIIPLEADAMKNIEMAFLTRRFCVLPRGGWDRPTPTLPHYTGIVWRENVGGFGMGKRFIKAGGFSGKADWCGIVRVSTIHGHPDQGVLTVGWEGRWLFFEAKKDEKTQLSPIQKCMHAWMETYGAMCARVWDYKSTIDALARFGL